MRNLVFTCIALGTLAGGLATSANAMPIVGGTAVSEGAPSNIQPVWWRRVCGPYRCHWVWFGHHRRWW